MSRERRDDLLRALEVVELVRADVRRECDEREAAALRSPFGDVAFAAGMLDADAIERAHGGVAAGVAEVLRVIVGEAHDVEAGVAKVVHVARWRAEDVAGARAERHLCDL